MPDLDLETIRRQMPSLDGSIYMNTGGTGPLPTPVVEEITSAYQSLGESGPDLPDVRGPIERRFESARDAAAELFGVSSDEIALLRAVSEGLSTVAFGMDWKPGDEVIVTDEEHPTGIMVWLNLEERSGIKVRKLPLVADRQELLARLADLISDRTRLVSISHVTTDTGTRLPAREICSIAHSHGVPVFLDAAQSVGQFPVDLREMDCDFYAATGHKWLLGGWGTAMFYVRKDWIPRLKVSWTGSHAGKWDRETDMLTFDESARRFEFGGRHYPLYAGMARGIEFVQSAGLENIEARSRALADRLKAAIAEISGATLRSPESHDFSTGIVTFSVDGLSGPDLNRQMMERWSVLGRHALTATAMRLSCAFFNSDQEIDTIIDAISTLANENRRSS